MGKRAFGQIMGNVEDGWINFGKPNDWIGLNEKECAIKCHFIWNRQIYVMVKERRKRGGGGEEKRGKS
jgi:hypothetical protein